MSFALWWELMPPLIKVLMSILLVLCALLVAMGCHWVKGVALRRKAANYRLQHGLGDWSHVLRLKAGRMYRRLARKVEKSGHPRERAQFYADLLSEAWESFDFAAAYWHLAKWVGVVVLAVLVVFICWRYW